MRCTMRACLAVQVLLAALITQSMAQPESGLPFGPVFSESQYDTREGKQLAVRLSAPILSLSAVSTASGSIEVDIIVESPPSGGSQQHAENGADYIVNTQDTQSKIFTVTFQSKQSLSSAYVIQIVDDLIPEGREYFLLRINEVRYFGQLKQILRTQDGLTNTSILVSIEDDDNVQVHWNMSQISTTEGEEVKLRAVAIGTYAIPIAIGVTAIGTGVQPAISGKDFSFTSGTKLHFSNVGTTSSFSDDELVIQITDDNIAEPRESFICKLQGDSLNAVQVTSPFQATIEIKDNDELVVHWAKDFYEFTEGDLLTEVELVTESDIEVDQVSISGLPRQIPNEHMTHIAPILVPGPSIPGFTFDISIERVKFRGAVYGNAQVTQAGRADVQRAASEFVFTPFAKSAFQNFTIVDDNVLELDELFTAELDLGTELANWNVRIEEPSVLYCLIRDNDFVKVSFSEKGYTVNVSEGQVTITLRITGKFFIPVYAIIEVTDGTATDPEDYSAGTRRYNVTFPQTAYTDQDDPELSAISDPISFKITKDVTVLEDVEYFQARIVETSSESQVKIAKPDIVNITIIEDKKLVVHWARDFYEFTEGDLLTEVELVTDSDIEVDQVSISGLPRQIPNEHMTLISPILVPGPSILGFAINVSIERVRFRGTEYGKAQVTQAGRTDVQSMASEFVFTPTIKSAFQNLTIVDDDVLEFDELFIAEFSFGPELSNNWKVKIGEPSVLFCLIRDNDFVEVHFNEDSYTVGESEGQVSLSLRITGQFFIPVYAIIEVTDGTATDPEDYSAGARRFNVTFPQTAYTDQDHPDTSAVSHSISITIKEDDIFEDVEYFQARIVETSSESLVKIAKPDTVNVTIIQDKVKAVTITPNQAVLGRVTQTLTLECKAMVNVDDSNVTFTWKKMGSGVVNTATVFSPTNGMATATLDIPSLSVEEHHDQSYECHPGNAIGSGNFTSFKITVELFPPPNITKFAFQPDSKDAVDIEWSPVDVRGYPGASVEEYYIELARDKDESDNKKSYTIKGSNTSHAISVEECSKDYRVRIKAVNGDQDVSTFSDWTPLESVNCPVVVPNPTAGPHVPPGWAIFLIVFFLLLLCLLCILLLCCILLCCKWNRDPKGVYNAEKREKIYQDMASHSVYGRQECGSLERKEKTPEKRPPTPDSVSSV